MPTYQYACTECGHQLEAVQSFSDAPLTECPACQGRLRKLFNSVGIVFKGSGFYRTDSRNGSTASESSKSTSDAGSSSTKAEGGSSGDSASSSGGGAKEKVATTGSTSSSSSSGSSTGGTASTAS